MNHKITAFAVMIAVVGLFSSCLTNSSDYTTYDDALITSFSLGTVKCTRTIHKSDGTDSTYTYSYSASTYPMSIDQINNRIFNIDSLVMGTKVSRILTTVSTKNSGTVLVKSLDNDSTWTYYSSSDSLDYTSPRLFRVFANDGQAYRDYTVTVNVHKEAADSFTWNVTMCDTLPEEYKFRSIHTALHNGEMYLLGTGTLTDGGDTYLYNYLLASPDGQEWEPKATPDASTFNDTTIVAANGKLYMIAGGDLYETQDPESESSWTLTPNNHELKALCGGDEHRLYAIDMNNEFVSLKAGESFFDLDELEDTTYNKIAKYIPTKDLNFASSSVKTNEELSRFTIIGNGDKNVTGNDSTALLWYKIYDKDDTLPWTLTTFNGANHYYTLPNMDGLTAVYYADGLLAMGGKSNNKYAKNPYSCIYYSPDFGATWHTDTSIALPKDYDANKVKSVKLLADGKTLYFVALGEVTVDGKALSTITVWRAHQNKVNWAGSTYVYK